MNCVAIVGPFIASICSDFVNHYFGCEYEAILSIKLLWDRLFLVSTSENSYTTF